MQFIPGMSKLNFQQSFAQSSVSLDPSEIILIPWCILFQDSFMNIKKHTHKKNKNTKHSNINCSPCFLFFAKSGLFSKAFWSS